MSLHIAYGYAPHVYRLDLSSQQHYFTEELSNKLLAKTTFPHWLLVNNIRVRIPDETCIPFACEIVSTYHNDLCFNDHGDEDYYAYPISDA